MSLISWYSSGGSGFESKTWTTPLSGHNKMRIQWKLEIIKDMHVGFISRLKIITRNNQRNKYMHSPVVVRQYYGVHIMLFVHILH